MLSLGTCLGSLVCLVLQYLVSLYSFGWRLLLTVPAAVLAMQAVQIVFLPETPRWLLAKKTPTGELLWTRSPVSWTSM